MFEERWFWLPVFEMVRKAVDWPRRILPEVPFLSEWVAVPNCELQLGQEMIPPDEDEKIRAIIDVLRLRHQRSYPAGVRPMQRDFHTKAHGCLTARFTVEPNLPAEYRHGIFASEREYNAILRFSNGQRAAESDLMPTPHGIAIKLLNVPDAENGGTRSQDFLLADFPVNMLGDVADSLEFYQIEAANKPQAYFASPLPLRLHLKALAIGVLSAMAEVSDVFDISYFSQTPYRLGPGAACKYIVRPSDPARHPNPDYPDNPNFLRDQMMRRLRQGPIELDFLVQRQIHPVRQPVEDASVEWDQREAVPHKVATISIAQYQVTHEPFTSPKRGRCCENLSFNPDNALPASLPLGGLNRLRRRVYHAISAMRHDANGIPQREPTSIWDFERGSC
jgi:hypothetical protein